MLGRPGSSGVGGALPLSDSIGNLFVGRRHFRRLPVDQRHGALLDGQHAPLDNDARRVFGIALERLSRSLHHVDNRQSAGAV
jgi:hypothetical protein